MPLPQQYDKAIMDLGNIGVKVNLMTQQAISLKTQRVQTFDILNRLRTLIRKLLTSYSGNKDTLQQVYNDIMTATTRAGKNQQRNLLEELANELKKSLEDPTTEQQFTQLKQDVEGLISRMNIATSSAGPGPGAGAGAGAAAAAAGAAGDGAGDGAGSSSERSDVESSSITDNFISNIDRKLSDILGDDKDNTIGGKRRTKSGKRRTKRGGYSWRTPSPNKSRKKTPSYKKTIKKTRTRQN